MLLPSGLYRDPSEDPSLDVAPAKRSRNKYRSVAARSLLEEKLQIWRLEAHSTDPLRLIRPPYLILSDANLLCIAKALPELLSCPADIVSLLEESEEWAVEWAEKIYQVVRVFDLSQKTDLPPPLKKARVAPPVTHQQGLLTNISNTYL